MSFWVLDIDCGGERAFGELLVSLGAEQPGDLTSVITRTPSGGYHLYFKGTDTPILTRAPSLALNIDVRGDVGSIILPGNILPDGRCYEAIGVSSNPLDAPPAPRKLEKMVCFSPRELAEIKAKPHYQEALKNAQPRDWRTTFDAERKREAARVLERCRPHDDDEGIRRQALHDLHVVAEEYAALQDGRRNKLFSLACRVARYVAHRVLTEEELSAALINAARINGALSKHGITWARGAIQRALIKGRHDPLPPLARAFRTDGEAA